MIEAHLRRIEAVNPSINAVTVVLGEQALDAAKAADREVAAGGDLPPLHGVPFTVKANIDLAGTPTTLGLKALAGADPRRDAPVVERMRAAGAIPIGRTNCPTFTLRWHAPIGVQLTDRRRDRQTQGEGPHVPGDPVRRPDRQAAAAEAAVRQRVNVTTASIPRPEVPLYLAGARVLEVFPVLPLIANEPLGVGALSYAGTSAIGVVADQDACPDIDVFTAAMRDDLHALGVATPIAEGVRS